MDKEMKFSEERFDPAFPIKTTTFEPGEATYYGISRRGYIAAKVLAQIAATYTSPADAAKEAVMMADALIAELDKEEQV